MKIDKDTKLYGSFSNNPGNNGCIFFNEAFERYGINAIYKSFYSDDVETLIKSVKHLGFAGFALSMPLKTQVFKYLDYMSPDAMKIGAVNTVLNNNGVLEGYNTDWIGVKEYFLSDTRFWVPSIRSGTEKLTILGNGGFSKAIQYVCDDMGIDYSIVTRENWDSIPGITNTIFNATPVDVIHSKLIDGRPFTKQGKIIASLQAREQFKLYTGIKYE